jgi:probable rRNA maturation factor
VNSETIQATADFICRALGFRSWELSISFVDSDEIRALNNEYRKIDKSTDVLSFPQQEWMTPVTLENPFQQPPKTGPVPFMLGDLVISLEDAEHNAKDIGHSLDRETGFLLVHGILHLCGHDHQEPEEEEIMTNHQRILMQKMSDEFQIPLWNRGATAITSSRELQQ